MSLTKEHLVMLRERAISSAYHAPFTIYIVDRTMPGYVLPFDVPVTDDFRKQFNIWAEHFFKRKILLDDGVVLSQDFNLVMTVATYQEFKKELKRGMVADMPNRSVWPPAYGKCA